MPCISEAVPARSEGRRGWHWHGDVRVEESAPVKQQAVGRKGVGLGRASKVWRLNINSSQSIQPFIACKCSPMTSLPCSICTKRAKAQRAAVHVVDHAGKLLGHTRSSDRGGHTWKFGNRQVAGVVTQRRFRARLEELVSVVMVPCAVVMAFVQSLCQSEGDMVLPAV